LADRPRIHHVIDGQLIYAFLDSSREYGTGLAVYQLTGDPQVYSKARLVPLHFMSRKLSAAEANYWPTDMEMSGLVWAVKKLRPYMERAYVWFVTDHKPKVDIFEMKSLVTSSTARSNLRLQTWGIALSQFWGKMNVLYSKGSKIDCPDALSRLQYELPSRWQVLRDWALRLEKEPDTAEFEVTEAFAVTRSSRKPQTPAIDTAPAEHAAKSPTGVAPVEHIIDSKSTRQQWLAIVPSEACKKELWQAVRDSAHFSAIRKRLMESDNISKKWVVSRGPSKVSRERCDEMVLPDLASL
jgi:hypothetical protein